MKYTGARGAAGACRPQRAPEALQRHALGNCQRVHLRQALVERWNIEPQRAEQLGLSVNMAAKVAEVVQLAVLVTMAAPAQDFQVLLII